MFGMEGRSEKDNSHHFERERRSNYWCSEKNGCILPTFLTVWWISELLPSLSPTTTFLSNLCPILFIHNKMELSCCTVLMMIMPLLMFVWLFLFHSWRLLVFPT